MYALALGVAAGLVFGGLLARRHHRRSLNEALHELRRPLHALALAAPGEAASAWLGQAGLALAELDRRVNGGRRVAIRRRTSVAELVSGAARRWRGLAEIEFAPVERGAALEVAPGALDAALDNLIANALEHGGGAVVVSAVVEAGEVKLRVENRPGRGGEGAGDPRRGHGLGVARRAAGRHAGQLRGPEQRGGAISAALELPVAAER